MTAFTYYKGYNTGYSISEAKHDKERALLLESHRDMEASLTRLSNVIAGDHKVLVDKLQKNLNIVLRKNKEVPLTTVVDCNPSKEFIEAWNALSTTSNTSDSP